MSPDTLVVLVIIIVIIMVIIMVTIMEVIILVIIWEWCGGNLCHEPLETVNHGARELTLVTECEIQTAGKCLECTKIQRRNTDIHNL